MRKSVRCQMVWPLGHQRERASEIIKSGRKAAPAAMAEHLSHGKEHVCWLAGAENGRERFARGLLSWDPRATSSSLALPLIDSLTPLGLRCVDQKLRN